MTVTKPIVQNIWIATEIYIHGSMHHNSILIRSKKMQQYACIYLLQNSSTCFGCLSHPSSGVFKTVTAASGTSHSIRATTFLQRDQLTRLEEGCFWYYDLYQKLQLQFYVLLMMGAIDTWNMWSNFAVNKYMHTVASSWILLMYCQKCTNNRLDGRLRSFMW